MPEWPSVPLHRLITENEPRLVTPADDDLVRYAGVRWYGAGLFIREERVGKDAKGKCYALKPGALIYNRLFAWKQSFAVVGDDFEGVVVSNEFPQFDVDPAQATAEFLALYCSSPAFADRALALSTGSAAVSRNRLKQEDFIGLTTPCPPVPVQKSIVAAMGAVDDAIAAAKVEAERLSGVLKIRRAALVNSELFPTIRADAAFDIRLGRQRSPQRAVGPPMTPYLRSANIGPDELRLDDVMSMDFNAKERIRYALKDGDVLVSEGSAGAEAVGMPAAWHGEIEGPVCFQNTLLRYRAVEGQSIPEFVRHWCLWAYESGTFRDTAPAGVNIKHIRDRRAKGMPVRLPGIDEQEALAAELEPMARAVASLRTEAPRLRIARAALLDSLMAGEIDIATNDP